MTRASAKDFERRVLMATLDRLGIAVTPEDVEDREGPDFFVCNSRKILGVELVGYSQATSSPGGYPIRQVEGEWQQFRKEALAASRTRSELRGVDVFLHFYSVELPPRSDWSKFLEEIAGFVNEHRQGLDAENSVDVFPTQGYPLMQRHLSGLTLAMLGDHADWGWNGEAGWIGLAEDELRSIFAKKAAKRYEPPDQLWLLVHGGTDIGCMLPLRDNTDDLAAMTGANHVLQGGPFDRVLLLSPFRPSPICAWTRAAGWHVVKTGVQI